MHKTQPQSQTIYLPPSHSTPIPNRPKQHNRQLLIFLALWLLTFACLALPSILDPNSNNPDSLLTPLKSFFPVLYLSHATFFLCLWFSIQYSIATHYIPTLPTGTWVERSVSGLFLGIIVGCIVGTFGFIFSTFALHNSYDLTFDNPSFTIPSILGLLSGFTILAWIQNTILKHHIPNSILWYWPLIFSIAWYPAVQIWSFYDGLISLLVINPIPDLHNIARFFAVEVALLVPVLLAFAAYLKFARQTTSPTTPPTAADTRNLTLKPSTFLPRAAKTILLIPCLALILLLASVLISHFQLIDRAWIGPANSYLQIDPTGQIITTDTNHDPTANLITISPDKSLRAYVSKLLIKLSPPTSPNPLRLLNPFPTPTSEYENNKINIIRFNPTGTILAAGTGSILDGDSSYYSISDDHAVHVFSIPDGALLYTLIGPEYSVQSLAWSPDGQYLAAAGGINFSDRSYNDAKIYVWRVNPNSPTTSPTLYKSLQGHQQIVTTLAFTPDSTKLISSDTTGLTAIWHIK